MGQIIDTRGRKPDSSMSSTIKNMHATTNVSTLQAFQGLLDYFGTFIPNIHALRVSINHLLKGGAHGVMVIIAGNGHGDTSSNPGRDWLHFT